MAAPRTSKSLRKIKIVVSAAVVDRVSLEINEEFRKRLQEMASHIPELGRVISLEQETHEITTENREYC